MTVQGGGEGARQWSRPLTRERGGEMHSSDWTGDYAR